MEAKPVPRHISESGAEQAWWDQYGHVNEAIWQYSEYLTELVRRPYLDRMFDFLHKPGGRLLDFGCGNGWVSLPFAERGMDVVGIDLSSEQINRAVQCAEERGLNNARYLRGDLNLIPEQGPFDSVIVHSLLHHLPDVQKRALLETIDRSLVPNGRVFIYEPMATDPARPWYGALLDKAILGLFRLIEKGALLLGLFEPTYAELRRAGWQMISPSEAPIAQADLLSLLPQSFQLVNVHYWHGYSVKYANLCMALTPAWRAKLQRFAPLFCRLDTAILGSSLRDATRVWPMASFLVEKRPIRGIPQTE